MPAPLTSPSQSSQQPAARAHIVASAPCSSTHTANGLAGSRADSLEKFELRGDLDRIHRGVLDLQLHYPGCYLTSLKWAKNDDGLIRANFSFEPDAPGGRQGTLERIAFAGKVFTYVAIIQERGMMGQHRTVLVKDLHIFGEKVGLADHMWFSLDRKWRAIEPFYQGMKVVLVGPVVEYVRANGIKDYELALSKVVRLWEPAKDLIAELHSESSGANRRDEHRGGEGRELSVRAQNDERPPVG